MKLKVKELLGMKTGLQAILNCPLPVRISFELIKAVQSFDNEYEAYEKARKKLYEKLGEKDKKSGNITIPKKNTKKFKKEIEELLDTSITIEVKKIKVSDLGNDVKISPVQLNALKDIIEK